MLSQMLAVIPPGNVGGLLVVLSLKLLSINTKSFLRTK